MLFNVLIEKIEQTEHHQCAFHFLKTGTTKKPGWWLVIRWHIEREIVKLTPSLFNELVNAFANPESLKGASR